MRVLKKFLDPDDPFFRNPVVRWITVAVPTGWGLLELYLQEPFWAIMFLALGGYAAWQLLISRK